MEMEGLSVFPSLQLDLHLQCVHSLVCALPRLHLLVPLHLRHSACMCLCLMLSLYVLSV